MALPPVSHPPVQSCGGEDILYFYISWTPWVLDPITNPFGAVLAASRYNFIYILYNIIVAYFTYHVHYYFFISEVYSIKEGVFYKICRRHEIGHDSQSMPESGSWQVLQGWRDGVKLLALHLKRKSVFFSTHAERKHVCPKHHCTCLGWRRSGL